MSYNHQGHLQVPAPPSFAMPQQQHSPPRSSGGGQYQQQHHPTIAAVPQQYYVAAYHQQAPVTPQQQQQTTPPPVTTTTTTARRRSAPTKQKKKTSLEDTVLVTKTPDEETEDGRIRNREAMAKIRDTWIYKQVRARQHEFTNYKPVTVFCGTWNVNAKSSKDDDDDSLQSWLCADWKMTGLPDLVAVGFQEIVDLNAVNVAVDNKTTRVSQFWESRLLQTLNQGAAQQVAAGGGGEQFHLLCSKSMVGLLVCVYVRSMHYNRVKYVNAASVGVGVLGIAGNKGGVSIRLQFYDSTVCFVCTHLAAHRENVTGRNADFSNVLTKTTFEIGQEAIREVMRSGSLSHWGELNSSCVGISDHDICVWLGDLNYRIDESIMTEQVLKLSERMALDELRPYDQLNIERAAGRAFTDFEEGVLQFAPTYKYQAGTDTYEQRPDKKLRAPAWCDRILWMAQEPNHVQQVSYNRSERPNFSDHKPVYSTLRMTIKDVIQPKREAIYDELMKLLDRFENQTLPMIGLDRVDLDFGQVRYGQSVTLPIQTTNTGSVVAQFRFVPKLDEANICKPWMQVSPTYGMLIPGDQPLAVNFTLTIDNRTAQMLNSGREVLDDILILRLENGRDYYVTVKATYARSCFGMAAEELVLYSDPIRSIPLDPVKRAEWMDQQQTNNALCVPKELWRIMDAIYEKGLHEPHLFVEPGIEAEVEQIRECLDTGTAFGGTFSIHSYAQVLVAFLQSLALPIVPLQLFPSVEIDSLTIQSSARRLLEDLSPVHYNIFVYCISFFREVLQHCDCNLLTAAKVARVCSTSLCATMPLDEKRVTGMQLIMLHLLETSSI